MMVISGLPYTPEISPAPFPVAVLSLLTAGTRSPGRDVPRALPPMLAPLSSMTSVQTLLLWNSLGPIPRCTGPLITLVPVPVA